MLWKRKKRKKKKEKRKRRHEEGGEGGKGVGLERKERRGSDLRILVWLSILFPYRHGNIKLK